MSHLSATYALEVPGATPEQRGEEVAAEERTRLGLGDGPVADLRALLEEAVGVRVFYFLCRPRSEGSSPAMTSWEPASSSTEITLPHAARGRSPTNTATS